LQFPERARALRAHAAAWNGDEDAVRFVLAWAQCVLDIALLLLQKTAIF
jgi:hypothetical protein